MGFELNRLMQQYGVATPGRISYSGAMPVDPGTRPVATDALTGEALTKAQGDYDSLLAKYNFDKANQASDTAAYDAYKKEYQTRLQNTPMYMQSQFQTGNEPKSAGLQYAQGNMGVKQFNQNIQDWAAKNPDAYSSEINAVADKYGISPQDIYNATQNRWGNVLRAPKYATYTPAGAAPLAPPVAPPAVPPINDPIVNPPYVPPYVPPVIDDFVPSIVTKPIISDIKDDEVKPDNIPLITAPDILETIPTIYTKPIISDIKDDEVKPEDIPLITAPDILETIPSIYTKPIDSSIPDAVDTNIPLITPTTPLELPDFTVETPKEDKSFFDNPDFVEYGPSRGLQKNPEDLPEEFDKYLAGNTSNGDYLGSSDYFSDLGSYGGGYGGGKYFDDQSAATMAFAKGGKVKTHYQTAGSVSLPDGYINPEDEAAQSYPVNMTEPAAPVITEPKAPLSTIAMKNTPAPVAPVAVAKPPLPFGDERMGNIQALLAAYGPKESAYGEELKAARTSAKAESDAFAKLLSDAMKSPEDTQNSKAEMYFRLAAAFGAPTKTGHFAENLGLVGKELGDYSKEQRASRQQKLALAMKGQEMKMSAAKDDLRTLQALSAEEMKDKRTIATELIKDYIKSGEPQSTAGKQALDEGLKPGTPEYQKRVEQIGNMNIEGKLAQITASLANMNTAAANLALAQNKFENQKQQQTKLSPTEINMKKEAEDTIAVGKQSLADLKQAYALNPNSLAGGWMDKGQQWLAEAAGSKDPTIVNTRILNNLLGAQGLAKLKSTFGGNPTEGERAILLELEGIGSKTKEERAAVIKRTYKVLQDKQAREQARLDQINSGAYRSTAPIDGGNE
ncbi:MAG: hypothetical protein ACKO0Z_13800 [Betaproteobacteria bacterium]